MYKNSGKTSPVSREHSSYRIAMAAIKAQQDKEDEPSYSKKTTIAIIDDDVSRHIYFLQPHSNPTTRFEITPSGRKLAITEYDLDEENAGGLLINYKNGK